MAATDVATVGMSGDEAMRLVARLAMLGRVSIDAPHASIKGLRVVGFVIEADELSFVGEGVKMMVALQKLANIDLDLVHRGIDERIAAPFDLAAALARIDV